MGVRVVLRGVKQMEAFRPTIRKGKKRGVVRKYWAEGQFYAMPFMGCVARFLWPIKKICFCWDLILINFKTLIIEFGNIDF